MNLSRASRYIYNPLPALLFRVCMTVKAVKHPSFGDELEFLDAIIELRII